MPEKLFRVYSFPTDVADAKTIQCNCKTIAVCFRLEKIMGPPLAFPDAFITFVTKGGMESDPIHLFSGMNVRSEDVIEKVRITWTAAATNIIQLILSNKAEYLRIEKF